MKIEENLIQLLDQNLEYNNCIYCGEQLEFNTLLSINESLNIINSKLLKT